MYTHTPRTHQHTQKILSHNEKGAIKTEKKTNKESICRRRRRRRPRREKTENPKSSSLGHRTPRSLSTSTTTAHTQPHVLSKFTSNQISAR